MSHQVEDGVPVLSAPDGRGYRLFELPPELESMMSSQTAPVLYLQQPDSASSALLSVDGGGTYTLQQKNTSNALLLLAPTSSANTSAPTHERSVDGGLTAVSTLHETIELVIQAPDQLQKVKGKWHERFGRNR